MQQLKKDVYSVGAVDWTARSFHGYTTERGASYNSYLILDEKVTLIDTVKAPFARELINNIKSLVSLDKVEYIIVNHVEPDHSSALPEVIKACPNAKIIASSPMGGKNIKLHYGEMDIKEVKTGETLNIGKRDLTFVTSPMLHWPDNMVTYSAYDKILFSNDAFGQHVATSSIFDTDNELDILMEESKKYYANILMPFGSQAQKLLGAVSDFKFDTVATSHGVAWTKHIDKIVEKYKIWSSGEKENLAVVVYNTMWHSTEKMARTIVKAFADSGLKVKLHDLDCTHISDIVTDILTAKYVAVGSPTLNNDYMAQTAGFLNYLKGLAPKNLKGFAFGSYGWSGQSPSNIEKFLSDSKIEIAAPSFRVQFAPTEDDLTKLYNTATEIVK